jgi:glycosyltransferase involved in cell wall biosynthesis
MRIFMLVQHPDARGPVPKHTAHLVAALRALGSTVVTHEWGQRRADESLLEKVVERGRDTVSIRRVLAHNRFEVAVVKTSHDWRAMLRDIAVVLAIRRRCRPIVLQFHGGQASWLVGRGHRAFKFATALLMSLIDGVMVLSTEEENNWRAFRPRTRVWTVKNPYVPISEDASSSSGRVPQPSRLLFVGRLMTEKGIFELVDALPAVLAEGECELVIVGEGPQERCLREHVHRVGLDDRVRMLGYLAGADLAECYRDATVFVLPTWWNEGFPTVLAEAMDAGLPIVTTRIRGAADHLVPQQNALFVEPRNAPALAAALSTLLRDRDLRTKMSEANRQRVRMFEPHVVAAEYLEALRLAVAGRAEARSVRTGLTR